MIRHNNFVQEPQTLLALPKPDGWEHLYHVPMSAHALDSHSTTSPATILKSIHQFGQLRRYQSFLFACLKTGLRSALYEQLSSWLDHWWPPFRQLALYIIGVLSSQGHPFAYALLHACNDRYVRVRRTALYAGAVVIGDDFIPQLCSAFDVEERLQDAALDALAYLGARECDALFFQALDSGSPKVRVASIRGITRLHLTTSVPQLGEMLQRETDPQLRIELANALRALDAREQSHVLWETFEDSSPVEWPVFARSIRALEGRASFSRPAYQTLFQALVEEPPQVKLWAAEAIGLLGAKEVLERFNELQQTPGDAVPPELTWSLLEGLDAPATRRLMAETISDLPKSFQPVAARSFRKQQDKETLCWFLQQILQEHQQSRRKVCVWEEMIHNVGLLRLCEAVPMLCQLLETDPHTFKQSAPFALAMIGSKEAVASLCRFARNPHIQSPALLALTSFWPKEFHPEFERILTDEEGTLWRMALRVLRRTLPAHTSTLFAQLLARMNADERPFHHGAFDACRYELLWTFLCVGESQQEVLTALSLLLQHQIDACCHWEELSLLQKRWLLQDVEEGTPTLTQWKRAGLLSPTQQSEIKEWAGLIWERLVSLTESPFEPPLGCDGSLDAMELSWMGVEGALQAISGLKGAAADSGIGMM